MAIMRLKKKLNSLYIYLFNTRYIRPRSNVFYDKFYSQIEKKCPFSFANNFFIMQETFEFAPIKIKKYFHEKNGVLLFSDQTPILCQNC